MDLKNEIQKKFTERKNLEKLITKNTKMAAAQFCKRSTGSGYLSCYIDGIKRNRYIKKTEELEWKNLTLEWKIFSNAIMNWNKINDEIEKLFKMDSKSRLVKLPDVKNRKK